MDVFLVGFIGSMIFAGWRTGLFDRLIGIGFLGISLVAGAWFRYPVGALASTFLPDIPEDYVNLVGYTIAFPILLGGLHLARRRLIGETRFHGLTAEVDKGLGAFAGGLEAILIISAGIVILDTYFGTGSTLGSAFPPGLLTSLTEQVNASETVHLLRGSIVPVVLIILGPFLPKDMSSILPGGIPSIPNIPGVPGVPGMPGVPGFPGFSPPSP